MKKTELKKILKPLIKECVREAILEEGILSGIVQEVARGMLTTNVKKESPPAPADPAETRMTQNAFRNEQRTQLQEHKNKLMAAIGESSYNGVNLFEGTSPVAAEKDIQQMSAPLSDQEPSDPGVDIASLFGSVKKNWNAHMGDMKDGK
jgi:hypothetical protein